MDDGIAYHHGQPIDPPNDAFETAYASYRHLWKILHPEEIPVRDPITKRIVGREPNPARWDAHPELVALPFSVPRRTPHPPPDRSAEPRVGKACATPHTSRCPPPPS